MKDAACRGCGQTGHLLKVCRNKSAGQQTKRQWYRKKAVHLLEEDSSEDTDENCTLYAVNTVSKPHPYKVNIEVNDELLQMEIDTGCSLTLV